MESRLAVKELLAWLVVAFRQPTAEGLGQLAAVDVAALLRAAGAPAVELEPVDGDPAALAERLQTEYVRLFVARRGGGVAHLEAVGYLEEQGWEAQNRYLQELGEALRGQGRAMVEDAADPSDHLTVLLELLYSLDVDDVAALRRHPLTGRFLSGWVGQLLERLERSEPAPFYRNAGRVLEALLIAELPPED